MSGAANTNYTEEEIFELINDRKFDEAIKKLHGSLTARKSKSKSGSKQQKIRRQELQVMADTYLETDYSFEKLDAIEKIMSKMDSLQVEIDRQFESGELTVESYYQSSSSCLVRTFFKIEKLIGEVDFFQLYGVPSEAAAELIDKETFMQTHKKAEKKISVNVSPPTKCYQLKSTAPLELNIKEVEHKYPEQDIDHVVTIIFSEIKAALARGDEVKVPGFGSFSVVASTAKLKVDPNTGKKVRQKALKIPHFEIGKSLQQSLDQES
jgi:DNA-binding protein HU-beta